MQHPTTEQSGCGLSRFTYRNLADMAAAVPSCPLRVITHIDLDAYYAQCEMRRLGTDEDTPLVVQQWRNIIAVNYPARKFGIGRMVNVKEAQRLCPGLVVQHVPTWKEGESQWAYHADAYQDMGHHKVSLEPYRIRSREILAAIKQSLPPGRCRIEKAGIDEVFIDLSPYVHDILLEKYAEQLGSSQDEEQPAHQLPLPPLAASDLDWEATGSGVVDDSHETETTESDVASGLVDWDDVAMLEGARVVRAVRQALCDQLRFRCSAGIAGNKMLSKLGSSQHKPNKQTVVRPRAVPAFLQGLSSVTKMRSLGGKLGARVVAAFDTESVAELRTVPLAKLQARLGDDEGGHHIYWMLRGVDTSEVTARTELKSIISAKSFQPPLTAMDQAARWMRVFAAEIRCRLQDERLSQALLAAATAAPAPTESAGADAPDSSTENAAAAMESADAETRANAIGPDASGGQQTPPAQRLPQTIRLHFRSAATGQWRSRQTRIPRDGTPLDENKLVRLGTHLLAQTQQHDGLWPCPHLSLSVDGFEQQQPAKGSRSIEAFFQPRAPSSTSVDGQDQHSVACNINSGSPLSKRRRMLSPPRGVSDDDDSDNDASSNNNSSSSSSRNSNSNSEPPTATLRGGRNGSTVQADDDTSTNSRLSACARCERTFATAIQLREHQDWHVARALQAEEKLGRAAEREAARRSPLAATAATTTAAAAAAATTTMTTTTTKTNTRQRRIVPKPAKATTSISSFFTTRTADERRMGETHNNQKYNKNDPEKHRDLEDCKSGPSTLACSRCAAAFHEPVSLQVHEDWHVAMDLERG